MNNQIIGVFRNLQAHPTATRRVMFGQVPGTLQYAGERNHISFIPNITVFPIYLFKYQNSGRVLYANAYDIQEIVKKNVRDGSVTSVPWKRYNPSNRRLYV